MSKFSPSARPLFKNRRLKAKWNVEYISQISLTDLEKVKVKVNLSYVRHEDVQENGGIASGTLNLDTRW